MARTDEASRREMAAVKLVHRGGGFHPGGGIRRSLLAAGLEAELEEDFSQRLIRVTDARIIERLPDPGRSQGPGAPDLSPPISRWSLTSVC